MRVPPGNWIAPAGSSRSGSGGNEVVEASDAKDRSGGPASRQAVTQVNIRGGTERFVVDADPSVSWGRPGRRAAAWSSSHSSVLAEENGGAGGSVLAACSRGQESEQLLASDGKLLTTSVN